MEITLHTNKGRINHCYLVMDRITKSIHYETSIFSLQDSVVFCENNGLDIVSPFFTNSEEVKKYRSDSFK